MPGELPNDVSRCAGEQEGGIGQDAACARRDTCLRYTERKPGGGAGEWYIHPQIPGPCIYYMPKPQPEAPGREETKKPKLTEYPHSLADCIKYMDYMAIEGIAGGERARIGAMCLSIAKHLSRLAALEAAPASVSRLGEPSQS